jgi:hypothetical protein
MGLLWRGFCVFPDVNIFAEEQRRCLNPKSPPRPKSRLAAVPAVTWRSMSRTSRISAGTLLKSITSRHQQLVAVAG